jgi:hypothetical protein
MIDANDKTKESLEKLLRLQKVRIRVYEKKMNQNKQAYIEAKEELLKREHEITKIKDEHKDLRLYSDRSDVLESPVKRDYVKVRRYWLNYDLEMHEYYYEQEVEDHDQAKNNYDNARSTWMKAKLKNQKMQEEYNKILVSISVER